MDPLSLRPELVTNQSVGTAAKYERKQLPPEAVIEITEQQKARILASEKRTAELLAASHSQWADHPEIYWDTAESRTLYETNVAELDESSVKSRIRFVTDMIQNGEAEKIEFRAGNGDQTTTSIHQFLYWLQLRAKEFDNDGTYSPDMFK